MKNNNTKKINTITISIFNSDNIKKFSTIEIEKSNFKAN